MDALTLNGQSPFKLAEPIQEFRYSLAQRIQFQFLFIASALATCILILFSLNSWKFLLFAVASAGLALESLIEFRRRHAIRFVIDDVSITAVNAEGVEVRVPFEDAQLLQFQDEREHWQVLVLLRDGTAIQIPRNIAELDLLRLTLSRRIKKIDIQEYICDTRVSHITRPLVFPYPERSFISFFLFPMVILLVSLPSEGAVWGMFVSQAIGFFGMICGMFAAKGVFPSTRRLEVDRDGLSYIGLFMKRTLAYSDIEAIELTSKKLIVRSVYNRITYPTSPIYGQKLLRILRAHCQHVVDFETHTLPWELHSTYGPRRLINHAVIAWAFLATAGLATLIALKYFPSLADKLEPVSGILSFPVVLAAPAALIAPLALFMLYANSIYRIRKHVFTVEHIQKHTMTNAISFPASSLKTIKLVAKKGLQKTHILLLFDNGTLRINDGSIALPLIDIIDSLKTLYPQIQA